MLEHGDHWQRSNDEALSFEYSALALSLYPSFSLRRIFANSMKLFVFAPSREPWVLGTQILQTILCHHRT